MKFYIKVPVRPEPQARPRANFKNRHAYSEHPDFYHLLVYYVRQKWVYSPFQVALRLGIRFCYKRPATRRFEIYKTSRADLDNLEKAVMDALTTARVWDDDALVVDKRSVKVWGDSDYCEILVEPLKNIMSFGEGQA